MANSSHINYNETRAAFGPPRINPDQSLNINAIECSRTNRSGQSCSNAMQQSRMVASEDEQIPSSPPGALYRQQTPQNAANLQVPQRRKEVRMVGGLVPKTPPRPFYNVQIQEQQRPGSPTLQSPYLPQQNQQGLVVPRCQEYIRDVNRNAFKSPPRSYPPSPKYTPDRFATSHNYGNGANQFTDSHLDFSLSDLTEYKDIKAGIDNRHKQEFRKLGVYDPNAPGCSKKAIEREKKELSLIGRQNEEILQLKRDAHLANVRKHQFNRRILEVVSHGPNSSRHSSQTVEESSENKNEHLENFKKYCDVVISRIMQKHAQQIVELMNNRAPETTDKTSKKAEKQLLDELKLKQFEEIIALGKDLDERFKRYMENVEHPVIQITETTRTGPNNEVVTERVTTEGGDENGEEDQIIHVENESPEENSINLSIGAAVTYILNRQNEVIIELQQEMDEAIKTDSSNDVKVHYENKMKEVVLYYEEILRDLLSNIKVEYHKQLIAAGFKQFENIGNLCAENHCGEMQGSQNQGMNQSGVEYGPQNQSQRSTTEESVVVVGPENNPIRQHTVRSEIIEYGPENQPLNQSSNSCGNQNPPQSNTNQRSPCSGANQRGVQFAPVNHSQRPMNQNTSASNNQIPPQCPAANESQLRRDDYASFRSCLTTLFEKQNAVINHLKERHVREQQENPGVSLKEKHDLQIKLIQDYNLKEFNEIWQLIIRNNPSILRKLPPISVPPQIQDNVRLNADNVENAQSLSNSVPENCNINPNGNNINNNGNNINNNGNNINNNGNNVNSLNVNSCMNSQNFANINNSRTSSRVGDAPMNNAAVLNPNIARANNSCIANSRSNNALVNNVRNVPQASRPMVNASTGPSSSAVFTSLPINTSSTPIPNDGPINNVVTTVTTTRSQRGCNQAITQTSETVTTREPENKESEIGTSNCPCIERKNKELASMNTCPCMSLLPSVSELDELEETEKGELNRCLRRWQSCRRDIVLHMSKK